MNNILKILSTGKNGKYTVIHYWHKEMCFIVNVNLNDLNDYFEKGTRNQDMNNFLLSDLVQLLNNFTK